MIQSIHSLDFKAFIVEMVEEQTYNLYDSYLGIYRQLTSMQGCKMPIITIIVKTHIANKLQS